jgi:hypothetical protein
MELIDELTKQIIKQYSDDTDKLLLEFFTPYIQSLGIKGEITKGKLKWRGIKLKVKEEIKIDSIKRYYQLTQRGIDISEILEINYNTNFYNQTR